MSNDIYSSVLKTKTQRMERERVEMVVDIYESADDFRTQTDSNTNRPQALQSTGSECVKNRSYRSASVFLLLLCVLLLTAVIVLCVLINTNNHQFHIKSKNITEERDQLLTKYTNITKERDELKAKYNDIMKLWTSLYDRWIYYQSSFYFISSEKKSWTESRRYCREREADLIIINNSEENDFVKKVTGGDEVWIGLSDSDEEGRWKWVDSSTLNSRFWGTGEPNGQTKENCVESYSSGWNDNSCNVALKWMCERNVFK